LDITALITGKFPDRIRHFKQGVILYWQSDPVDQIFFILDGAVKESCISADGKIYSFGIHGRGHLLGAKAFLLDGVHESVAEIVDSAQLVILSTSAFEEMLASNQFFSSFVMRELAHEASDASGKARDLSFLDVQQRLKHSLIKLAHDHGIPAEKGILIDLNITQEDIGALIAANRSTIATCLSELRTRGYLWKEGRRLVIIPPAEIEILDAMTQAVIDGDDRNAKIYANKAVSRNIDAHMTLNALTIGMKQIDRAYSRGEIELPDVVMAASAMKEALPLVEANNELEFNQEKIIGTVVIGTVLGDIHDIGKTIVAMLLRARNFRVIDLGVNVSPAAFISAIRQLKPDILALSALTTTTSLEFSPVIKTLKREGLRHQVKVIVGGGSISEDFAMSIGADGTHATAQGAVELAWHLCSRQ